MYSRIFFFKSMKIVKDMYTISYELYKKSEAYYRFDWHVHELKVYVKFEQSNFWIYTYIKQIDRVVISAVYDYNIFRNNKNIRCNWNKNKKTKVEEQNHNSIIKKAYPIGSYWHHIPFFLIFLHDIFLFKIKRIKV